MAEDFVSPSTSTDRQPEIPESISASVSDSSSPVTITNNDVIEFYKKNKDSVKLADAFLEHFGLVPTASPKTIHNKIKTVQNTFTYKKKTAEKKAEFLSKSFRLPVSHIERQTLKDTPRKRDLKKKLHEQKHEYKAVKRKLDELKTECAAQQSECEINMAMYERALQYLTSVVEQYKQATILHATGQEQMMQKLSQLQSQFEDKTKHLTNFRRNWR